MNDDKRITVPPEEAPVSGIYFVTHKGKGRNYDIKAQSHKRGHEIIYVDYGSILLELDGVGLELRAGDCVIIAGGASHQFRGVEGRPFDFLNILYSGFLPPELAGKPLALKPREKQLMAELKDESLAEAAFYEGIIIAKLTELICLLRRRTREKELHGEMDFPRGDNNNNFRSLVIARALNYLGDNYAGKLNAAAVSRHAHVSASYLRALIRAETGRNLREHLAGIRIEVAKKLLRQSTDNIAAVAAKTGYTSVPHFCLAFRRRVGMTPREYASSLGDPTEKKAT